ncbi:ribosomal protein S18-alanine N-acetyltransferase [Brevundimonas sp. UBA7534]|uniref:ribosomal protein S18-alanine N-acetyltransferase n=1 Tax=Brevundimonas sp. UBA7534 TaxID=1946138 RepID=UPI0025B84D0B|nr:ribosomal protein S18-alanine N-acetyltransferase [Brevundimonas sp. UBA7534]
MSDPHALAALHATAFPAPWSAAVFVDLLAQPGVFAVTEADGFILMRAVLDEAEILTLAVRPSARGAGLGGRLVGQGAVRAAQAGATRIFLEVAEDNAAARALYDRAGFRQIGRRRGYYDGGRIDALVLERDMAAPPDKAALP